MKNYVAWKEVRKPVSMRLRADLVDAAKSAAETGRITLTAFAARTIEEKSLRREFDEHVRMVREVEAADPERLARKSGAIRDGLAAWKADHRCDGAS
ncbi:hypothetical protein [Nocardia sp. NPDC057030]|uniref:hypothetical protein n=1 Tax=unclassified Nocardia TaxID=2637762 RepID=UPI003643C820